MSSHPPLPKNLFYYKLSAIAEDAEAPPHDVVHDVLSLVDLILYKNKQVDIAAIHQLLGPDLFIDLLHILGGKTLEFPSVEDFREIFTWALCYYQKEIQHKDWKELKESLGSDTSSIKWSMKNKQITLFLQELLSRKMKGASVEDLLRDIQDLQKERRTK